MNFIEFKKLLKDNNILLFDYDYRNIYKNMFILDKHINEYNEYNEDDNYFISPFLIIKKDKNKIKKIINKLVKNNLIGAKYLCNIKI